MKPTGRRGAERGGVAAKAPRRASRLVPRRHWASASLLTAALGGCAVAPSLATFQDPAAPCYDRARQPHTTVVDTHLHFRPFGGHGLPFDEVVSYLEKSGVLFANIYGIGQTLPAGGACHYYANCPGTPVMPSMRNDFANALGLLANDSRRVYLTLSMTFPDLSRPETVLPRIQLLDDEFPGLFRWMGEVNLVKQALFWHSHQVTPRAAIPGWAPFMAALRERGAPLAVHSDLGSDDDPTAFLAWIEDVARLYPENTIIWMHMGLSKELAVIAPREHIAIMERLLGAHPNLWLDLSWRVLEDQVFSDAAKRAQYLPFLNAWSHRLLPGTDFVASHDKTFESYRSDLEAVSRIHRHLDDTAFRNIALGQNYFRLLNLDYTAPRICGEGGD